MRINLKYNIVGLALLILFSVGCDKDQIVEEPISTDRYPVATFTTDFTGSEVFEGDTIKYTITLDKMLDRALTFTLKELDENATAVDGENFIWETVVIAPYTKEANFNVIFPKSNVPAVNPTTKFEIGVFGIADKNLLGPATKNPVLDLTIKNNALKVSFAWSPVEDNDMDIVIVDDPPSAVVSGWAGATGANPEYTSMSSDLADGTYYLEVDPYDIASTTMDFTIVINANGGSLESFTGTFDMGALDTYEDGGVGKRILKIVKAGTDYTYTQLIN